LGAHINEGGNEMKIQENRSFGPPWVIVTRHGIEVAAAHVRADAEAYLKGEILRDELFRRNEAIEKHATA
jgi:hypothetical protein